MGKGKNDGYHRFLLFPRSFKCFVYTGHENSDCVVIGLQIPADDARYKVNVNFTMFTERLNTRQILNSF